MDFGQNHFTYVDYIVVGASLLISVGIGIYYAFLKQTTEDLLVGGRSMGPLPIAASMLVTYFSAISIIGYPSEIYYHGIQMFQTTIMTVLLVPISAYVIVPVFYNMKLTSVYTYLELRFDSVLTRLLGSLLFIIQVCLVMAVVLYAPAIPIQHIMGIPVWLTIVGIAICGTIYTSLGGIKAVVWTDVIQLVFILIGMFAIVVKGFISAGGVSRAFKLAGVHGRLELFNWSLDPFMRHNTANFFLGYGFNLMCLYSTHQPQVQRYSSLPTLKIAIRAILFSIPLNVITMILIVLTGISIFAAYADCDPHRSRQIMLQDGIVPFFVEQQLSSITGMLGLFISCIFSAVLSSISSALNSLVAVTWEDFFLKMRYFKTMNDAAKANMTRFLTLVYGGIIVGLSFMVSELGPILPLTLTAVGATAGPLASIFVMGLFMPCINKYGSITGLLAGLGGMFVYVIKSFSLHNQHVPLHTSVDGCPDGMNFTAAAVLSSREIEWPNRIFTVSYLLYPLLGALMTIFVGLIVSLLTGGYSKSQRRKINPAYLHPWIRKTCCSSSTAKIKVNASVIRTDKRADRISNGSTFPHGSSKSYTYYPYTYESVSLSPTISERYPTTVG